MSMSRQGSPQGAPQQESGVSSNAADGTEQQRKLVASPGIVPKLPDVTSSAPATPRAPPSATSAAADAPRGKDGKDVVPSSEETKQVSKDRMSEIRARVRKKLNLRENYALESNQHFDAITELIAEARFNRANLMNPVVAAAALAQQLSDITPGMRRAVHLRENVELSRNLRLPEWVHKRRQILIWYHCVCHLKLAEFAPGQTILQQGVVGTNVYWLLTGTVKLLHESGEESEEERSALLEAANPLNAWDLIGEEAMRGEPSQMAAVVAGDAPVRLAVLTADDFRATMHTFSKDSYDNSKVLKLLLMGRSERTPQDISDLAHCLSVVDLFKSMEPSFRRVVVQLVEYISVPEGFVVFEEGDKVDFCYVILSGDVVFTRFDRTQGRALEIGRKHTGEHFGTLTTLLGDSKKRQLTCVALQGCEFAVISKLGYNRLLKKQLVTSIRSRVAFLKGLSVLSSLPDARLQYIASVLQDETFSAGSTIINPQSPGEKLYFVISGTCKVVWNMERPDQPVPDWEDVAFNRRRTTVNQQIYADATSEFAMDSSRGNDNDDDSALRNAGAGSKLAFRKLPVEVAHLGRGDVLNGCLLIRKKGIFHVMAESEVKVVMVELEFVEAVLGKEVLAEIRLLVLQQNDWFRERLIVMRATRDAVRQSGGNLEQNRGRLPEAQSRHFLDHFIPNPTQTDTKAAQEQRARQADKTSISVVVGGAPGSTSGVSRWDTALLAGSSLAVGGTHLGGTAGGTRGTWTPQGRHRRSSPNRTPESRGRSREAKKGGSGGTNVRRAGKGGQRGRGTKPPAISFAGTIASAVLDGDKQFMPQQLLPSSYLAGTGPLHRPAMVVQPPSPGPTLPDLLHTLDASASYHAVDPLASSPSAVLPTQVLEEGGSTGAAVATGGTMGDGKTAEAAGTRETTAAPLSATVPAPSEASGAAKEAVAQHQHHQHSASGPASAAAAAAAAAAAPLVGCRSNPAATFPGGTVIQFQAPVLVHEASSTAVPSTSAHQPPSPTAATSPSHPPPPAAAAAPFHLPLLPPSASVQTAIVGSPMLHKSMLVQRTSSPSTSKFARERKAAIMSAAPADGQSDLAPSTSYGGQEFEGSSAAPLSHSAAASPRGGGTPSVVILPRMMSVYQSIIHTGDKYGVQRSYGLRSRKPASGSSLKHPLLSDVRQSADDVLLSSHQYRSAASRSAPPHKGQDSDAPPGGFSLRQTLEPLSKWKGGNAAQFAAPASGLPTSGVGGSDLTLPLEVDIRAPSLEDHSLSMPTHEDLDYILRRWGTRWSTERDAIRAKRHETLTEDDLAVISQADAYQRPLSRLNLFGLPTFDPNAGRRESLAMTATPSGSAPSTARKSTR